MRYLMCIRERLLAHALAFHKYQGLQQQVILAGLALHVVHHVSKLHVSIESENCHRKLLKNSTLTAPPHRPRPQLASSRLKITNSVQSQGLDTPANGNYIRMFGTYSCSF